MSVGMGENLVDLVGVYVIICATVGVLASWMTTNQTPKVGKPYTKWSEVQDEHFIYFIAEQVKLGRTQPGGLTTEGWDSVEKEMNKLYGDKLDKTKMKNRMRTLKKIYATMKRMSQHSGFGWNEETRKVDVEDDVWEQYLAAHPKDSKYRTKTLPYYNTLALIFGDTVADGETISHYFNKCLKACLRLGKYYVIQAGKDISHEISSNPFFYPWFKDCVGAIDGTHIPALIPMEEQPRYRNRKGVLSQNVLAVVDFDMKFQYVLSGWEGSASDSRVLRNVVWERSQNRLKIPNEHMEEEIEDSHGLNDIDSDSDSDEEDIG
ncbi:hypothetical protein KY285_036496 [Solanum tuberosum]|nr:hypothetical protein KY285_036496 [Solanum tuberosum]